MKATGRSKHFDAAVEEMSDGSKSHAIRMHLRRLKGIVGWKEELAVVLASIVRGVRWPSKDEVPGREAIRCELKYGLLFVNELTSPAHSPPSVGQMQMAEDPSPSAATPCRAIRGVQLARALPKIKSDSPAWKPPLWPLCAGMHSDTTTTDADWERRYRQYRERCADADKRGRADDEVERENRISPF